MGRRKTSDFTPPDFEKLSREERQIRGRLATLRRMIEVRKKRIVELQKPITSLRVTIEKCEVELEDLKSKMDDKDFIFPTFRVEDYRLKGRSYVRGVWYVKSKKQQFYIGNESDVRNELKKRYSDFDSFTVEEKRKRRFDFYLPQLQLDFWRKEYSNEKRRRQYGKN